MSGLAFAILVAALAAGGAKLADAVVALLGDYPPLETTDYPNELVSSYVLGPWDGRGEVASMAVAAVIALAALFWWTGRDQRRLKREVRGQEYGGAHWASKWDMASYGHASTRRTVSVDMPERLGDKAKLLREDKGRFLHALFGIPMSVPNPMPAYLESPRKETKATIADDQIILSEHMRLQHSKIPDPKFDVKNRHMIVLGGSGSWKTTSIVLPFLMQLCGSTLTTDPKGSTVRSAAPFLEKNGVDVKVVNIKPGEMQYSLHYNPFAYIQSTDDILVLADMLIENTQGEDAPPSTSNDYFDKAEKQLYYCLFGYVHFFFADYPQYQTFDTVIRYLQLAKEGGDRTGGNTILDRIILGRSDGREGSIWSFREWLIAEAGSETAAHDHDGWFVITQYLGYKSNAGAPETQACVISSCNVRLAPFSVGEVKRFFSEDELELDQMGLRPMAFFLIISDTTKVFNFIAAMLLYQFFQVNTAVADRSPGEHLPVPVTCILDEFANIGKVPDMDTKISTLRSRWIHLWLIMQDYDQLDKYYQSTRKTIVANCATTVYLGGSGEETRKSIAAECGKRTIPVETSSLTRGSHGSMSVTTQFKEEELMSAFDLAHNPDKFGPTDCLVLINNALPVLDKKFDYKTHPRYRELEAVPRLEFDDAYKERLERGRRARREAAAAKAAAKARESDGKERQ